MKNVKGQSPKLPLAGFELTASILKAFSCRYLTTIRHEERKESNPERFSQETVSANKRAGIEPVSQHLQAANGPLSCRFSHST